MTFRQKQTAPHRDASWRRYTSSSPRWLSLEKRSVPSSSVVVFVIFILIVITVIVFAITTIMIFTISTSITIIIIVMITEKFSSSSSSSPSLTPPPPPILPSPLLQPHQYFFPYTQSRLLYRSPLPTGHLPLRSFVCDTLSFLQSI